MRRFLFSISFACGMICALARAEDISGAGWRLWPDQQAAWRNDTLYLPSEVQLDRLPVNPPTGGWQALNASQGIPVTLPSTVEEHYWGKLSLRPYGRFEAQKGRHTSFPNGAYDGVSWWWREIDVPHFRPGQRLLVSFRGARLRSEVYCNGKLCGYSIMTELPFQADLTNAVTPGGKALLAVRITNPGGDYDWIDFCQARIQWGKYTLPPSHGFGGLDRDIQLDVRDNVAISDLAAINEPDLHRVRLVADVTSATGGYEGPVRFDIVSAGKPVWTGTANVQVGAGETKTVQLEAQVDSAKPWSPDTPSLYQARAKLPALSASGRTVNFGFRFFTARGIGSQDATLTLNGKRIVVVSAISWGYWGRNGLWPDPQMAMREVSDAKKLGLNCLTFHRTIGKPEVLDDQDRLGLLRYEEPGGGKFVLGTRYTQGPWGPNGEFLAHGDGGDSLEPPKGYVEPDAVDTSGSGPDGDPQVFWEKYEQEKILEMVKRDRSHPSLIIYGIQNESNPMDLRNPRIYRLLRSMHALDPSRVIVFYSGGVPEKDQVLMLPYSDEIRYGDKTIPYAGWRDCHTCGGPCNYLDNLYTDPTNFVQMQNPQDRKEICVWGEMLGAAVPDDYDKLVHSFDAAHPTGYELDDMSKVLAGYHDFLDKWGFRRDFPTDSSLFQAIGARCYYFWQRILEQSRAENANDMLVISGWESTTIDNHSGLVDNHRFFKGNPALIAKALRPEVLFLQPRHMIVARGGKDLVDVFLLDRGGRSGPYTLRLTARNPDGSVAATIKKAVQVQGGDVYGQLLTATVEVPAAQAGMLSLEARLAPQSPGASVLTGSDQIEVVDVAGMRLLDKIAVVEPGTEVTQTLTDIFHVTPSIFSKVESGTHLDAVVLATKDDGGEISQGVFAEALRRTHDEGTRLVLWPDTNSRAESFARALAALGIVHYDGTVGNLGAPWFGSWFFVRKHWLLDSLPTGCAMDWRYGVSAFSGPSWLHDNPPGSRTDGLLLDAPGMEVAVGYGADHNTKVGVAGCVIPYGKGQIVLYCLPELVQSLVPGNLAISPVICQRLLGNALRAAPSAL
ncbi:MAG: glycoside hydrolase family 2 TIM barrel-domain containing protein [Chthoniobacteraceae bacterium]|jgi:hypothetical protein